MSKHVRPWMTLFAAGTMSPILFVAVTAATQLQSLDSKDTFRAAALSSAEIKEIVKQVEDSAYDIADDWESACA